MNESVAPGAIVLVDTNVIVEAHRTGSWAALVCGYGIETVEDCVTETQTGYRLRPREQWIDAADLRATLAAVHEVSNRDRAELAVRVGGIALDCGEESLWAHALGRSGAWFLSGPDRASMRAGVRLGFRDRLVSLEELLEAAGHRLRTALNRAFTRKWTADAAGQMVVAELGMR